jgi:UDPglucose 6-dehydrogenase
MKITVVGTGYVGLVTGTCFSETGNKVTCVDIDKNKVDKLSGGQITIYEPGLEKIFLRNIKEGRLTFTTELETAIEGAEIIFLALPTPPGADGSADLKYVLGVADHLGKILKDYKVIVNKSTVPVGTAGKVSAAIAKNYKGAYDVVSNPEFLREGVAVDDFMKPDRVVVGTKSERAKKVMSDLYAPFVRQGNPVIFMDERSSELTKYAANSFLATKISFMNEVAQLCERMGADVDMVRRGIGSDDRIGNANQKLHLVEKIKAHFKGDLKGKHIALWGLAFKPNTDDIREAPALSIIDALTTMGATITAYDPEAMPNVKAQIGDKIKYAGSQYEALTGADFLIIATEWSEFRTPDFERIEKEIKNKIIFDGRNLFEVSKMKELGYHYESIGRASATK